MNVSIKNYQDYLLEHYKDHGIDSSLFMKLVEEIGEVAEVLNIRDGRKTSNNENIKDQLSNELVDVIHYAFAIASLNNIDLSSSQTLPATVAYFFPQSRLFPQVIPSPN